MECRFRVRIQIGDYKPLQQYQSECIRCFERFNILWPIDRLVVSGNRGVDLICPYCRAEFLVVARFLEVADNPKLKNAEAFVL